MPACREDSLGAENHLRPRNGQRGEPLVGIEPRQVLVPTSLDEIDHSVLPGYALIELLCDPPHLRAEQAAAELRLGSVEPRDDKLGDRMNVASSTHDRAPFGASNIVRLRPSEVMPASTWPHSSTSAANRSSSRRPASTCSRSARERTRRPGPWSDPGGTGPLDRASTGSRGLRCAGARESLSTRRWSGSGGWRAGCVPPRSATCCTRARGRRVGRLPGRPRPGRARDSPRIRVLPPPA